MIIKEVKSENEMKAFGEALGQLLRGGEVIELVGDVGSGKTTLVKGIARGLGIDEYIQSPSFTINRVYDGRDDIRLSHYDFYRLDEAGIMANEIGEVIEDKNVTVVIEWGAIINGVLPLNRISIDIATVDENSRTLTINATGKKSQFILGKLK